MVEHSVALPGPVIVTTDPGVAVPLTVGVVEVWVFEGPVAAIVGTGTAVTETGVVVVPPGPDVVTVTEEGPEGSVTEQLKVPLALAVVEHSVWLPGPVIVTVVPGAVVPLMG